MQLAAHQLAHVDLRVDALVADGDMDRTHADGHGTALRARRGELLVLLRRQRQRVAHDGDGVGVTILGKPAVLEEVHLRCTDEACDEQVRGMVEHLLRGADLLNEAVAHDDDAVAERHGLDLIVRDVDKGRVDLLAQLDDLRAHLVAQLRVKVRQRFVHQEHLGVAHDGAADGDALALTAGERLGLAVEVLGDVQNFRGFAHLAVDLVLGHLLELERERHVLIHRHVRVERVVLEDHRNVAVLGGHVVHQLAVDVQLARADLLQTRHHAQRGGFAAARRADEDDELAVGNVEVEFLHGDHALVGDLQVVLLLAAVPALLFRLAVGIDLLDVFQNDFCHIL